jgi:hypothetical protein
MSIFASNILGWCFREHPTKLEDPRMWGTWFLADVDSTYLNMGACIAGAYQDTPFSMKLDRPIDPTRRSGRRKKRDVKTDASSSTDAIEAYWDSYRNAGGVPSFMAEDVQCFKSQVSRDAVVGKLKMSECTEEQSVIIPNEEKV